MGLLAGLIAALAWTLASSLWRGLTTSLSALQLNGLKNGIATLLLLPVLLTLPWMQEKQGLIVLLLSGGVGIALGDSFYLAALRRLGTRRTLTVDALSPIAAAVGGVVTLGEQISALAWLGAALVTLSVLLIANQNPPDATGQVDRSQASQRLGLLCAIAAVL